MRAMTTTEAPSICAKCQRPLRSHFKIERIHQNGNVTVSASVCSIPCLLAWGYGYATMVGTLGAAKLRNTINTVIDLLQGKPQR